MNEERDAANKPVRVLSVLTEGLVVRLNREAQRQTTSRSQLIRRACQEFLDAKERELRRKNRTP